ncbi:MAG TPA: sialate O-acetylesterase [Longimicrobiaceae bacterium]
MKRALPLLAVITLAACSGGGDGPTPPPEQPKVASLDFTAPADSVEELKTLQLTAVPKDKNGNAMTTHVWLTVDSSRVATVHEQTRVLEAKAPGFVTVTATSENITKTMKVRVTPFGPTPPADRPGGWKVFLLMGQSNMEGQGDTVGYVRPDLQGRVFVRTESGFVPAREPLSAYGVGPGAAFAAELMRLGATDTIALVQCAVGGTTMEEWGRSTLSSSRYGACLRKAWGAYEKGRVAGVLFFQGESNAAPPQDRQNTTTTDGWGNLFRTFVGDLRQDLRDPALPVVFAQIGDYGPSFAQYAQRWATVQAQQAAVAGSMGSKVRMIETRGLARKDDLHYTTASYIEIGKRFGGAYWEIR